MHARPDVAGRKLLEGAHIFARARGRERTDGGGERCAPIGQFSVVLVWPGPLGPLTYENIISEWP